MRLTLDQVSVCLGGRPILSDVSTEFRSGEVAALMGPSGSGKSTLLAAIAGAINLESGLVVYDIDSTPDIEWLMQVTPLLQRRSVIDNVLLSLRIRDRAGQHMRAAVQAMKAVGILDLARSDTHLLSGGEKQRVGVARAIASKAPIILADEPTASLDAVSRESVIEALDAAAAAGALVIVATHDASVAARASRVLLMMDGNLEERGQQNAI